MYSGRTTTTVQAPASAPVDYNATKPTFGELAPLFGLSLITLAPVGLGGAIVLWSLPKDGALGGWGALGIIVGALLALGGLRFFWPLSASVPRAIARYYERLDEWHEVQLTKFEQSDGQIVAQQVSEWRYNPADMRTIGALFFWLLVEQPRSPTIESLTRGPLMLNLGHRSVKIMDMSQDDAADALNLLAAAGLIAGRGPRKAGMLALQDTPALARRLALEAAKNPQLVAMPEAEK
jgi:hypothetical protein